LRFLDEENWKPNRLSNFQTVASLTFVVINSTLNLRFWSLFEIKSILGGDACVSVVYSVVAIDGKTIEESLKANKPLLLKDNSPDFSIIYSYTVSFVVSYLFISLQLFWVFLYFMNRIFLWIALSGYFCLSTQFHLWISSAI